MNLSICTISFRHQLVSIEQLAGWAKENHFQGIELWGTHAKNLADQPQYNEKWLAGFGLKTTMISDYLPLKETEQSLRKVVRTLSQFAQHWGAKKIRTFAGQTASAATTEPEFHHLVSQLQSVCDLLVTYNLTLIIETHPNTYADSVSATERLFKYVARDNMKLNFDVLHVWESKAELIPALDRLLPHINHFHLKNISHEDLLDVFAPATVYSASGSREGMVSLFAGAVDYHSFLQYIYQHENQDIKNMDASLEWFGDHSQAILNRDRYLIQQLKQQSEAPQRLKA